MELKLTVAEAARMFGIWRRDMEQNPGRRQLENGNVKLDTVPSERGAQHRFDGSLVYVWYRAANPPTERAIREAAFATQVMNLPRQLYTGRLIDIKRGADDTVYFKVAPVERRNEDGGSAVAFRSFNPSKGQLLEMVINPAAAELLAAGQAPAATAYTAPPAEAPAQPAGTIERQPEVEPRQTRRRARRTSR